MHPSLEERRQWSVHHWGAIVGVGIVFLAFRNVDLKALSTVFRHLGALCWLIPVPFALAQCTETYAWKAAFRTLGLQMDYWRLLRIRLACEAVTATCPGGMLVAESIKPGLLTAQFGIPTELAVCGTVARKFLLLVSQCGYFAVATFLGIPALTWLCRSTPHGWWVAAAAFVALVALLMTATFVGVSLSSGSACEWLHGQLVRFPVAALRRVVDRARALFARTDSRLAEFCSGGPKRLAKPTSIYLVAWSFEGVETFAILSLLGVHLDWKTILFIEVCASMVRNLAFVSPSGLGAQDLSYAGLLQLFSVPNALSVAAAFTLLKRGKELLWSLVGYWLLLGLSNRNSPSVRKRTSPVLLSNPRFDCEAVD